MICSACGHSNLSGGVRCIYCGEHFPPSLDFELNLGAQSQSSPPRSRKPKAAQRRGGLLGLLAVLALKAKTWLVLLKLGKLALTFSTMLAFIAAESRIFGWKLAAGFGVCIFVHEMGHVFVNWRKGLKQTAPVFIPFVGAVIFLKGFPDDPTIQSESGAGGPVAGGLAALVCLIVGLATHNMFWLALANIGFFINLFNLIPFPPLDGSHISSVFSPRTWDVALIIFLLVVLKLPLTFLWVLIVVGFIFRLGLAKSGRYELALPRVRARMAAIYILLSVGLCAGSQYTLPARGMLTAGMPQRAGRTTRMAQPAPSDSGAPAESDDYRARARAHNPGPYAGAREPYDPDLTLQQDNDMPLPAAILIVIVMCVTAAVIAFLLWLATGALLARASGQKLAARHLTTLGAMMGLFALLVAALPAAGRLHAPWSVAVGLFITLGGFIAASVAALVNAGYQSHHAAAQGRPSYPEALASCLSWAAAAALLVAYATNNLILLAVVLACAAIYVAAHSWIVAAVRADIASALGDPERALALRKRAAMAAADPETKLAMWTAFQRLAIRLDHGADTLEAADAIDGLLPRVPSGPATRDDVSLAVRRAVGYTLVERFDDALACCERILQARGSTTSAAARLLMAHNRMQRIAQVRGWADEHLAQTEWCLRVAAPRAIVFRAGMEAKRAQALYALGRTDESAAACAAAVALHRSAAVEAVTSATLAEIAADAGDGVAADRQSLRAVRLMPGELEIRFRRGSALYKSNGSPEGEQILRSLANDFPREHWGRQAKDLLNPPPAESAFEDGPSETVPPEEDALDIAPVEDNDGVEF
jgi:Zn-dependent protease/tetratricopeptide (TPR) repeat protein